jgi:tol-pal system protein YbgF
VAGCALRGDVRKVELQVEALRSEFSRSDTARRAERDSLIRLLAALHATLVAQQTALTQIRGDVRTDLQAVQQQLGTLQELTGQSQQRLSELRSRIATQAPVVPSPVVPADSTRAMPPGGSLPASVAPPGADQMYDLSLQQYRRGSFATARLGFREFLRLYSDDDRAADALYYIGESFASENADSAAAVYQDVVKRFPNSPRAPSALYKLGLLAEQRGNKAAARTFYARVVAGYPRSDEANLARDKLQALGR